ncbi:LysE family translocator [Bifidobacterium saguinibicoloris]|uniref:LysE family translocator n=1 Tax=Bifidobacterium saguinibicoloris TaxID=2834433 RepID=UPI001C58C53B|nr:LysE family translocator [Bifidobacterium saguinibicoloris]MBW3080244.1 LysE family translocator [Bifidobacterium saguinibicoloris]
MTYAQALLGFALVAGSMALLPGLDMMMVVNETINSTRRRGIAAACGISFGVLAWAVAAAVGLAALINAFPLAYDAIRLFGGVYLLYLAFSLVRRPRRKTSDAAVADATVADATAADATAASATRTVPPARSVDASDAPDASDASRGRRAGSGAPIVSSFVRGFLTDLFNPKIGVFYIAVIPQFLVPGVDHLRMGVSLGLIHFTESMLVLITLACMAAFFAGKLRSERSRRVLSLVSAGIMAVLGGVTIADAVRSRLAA